MENKSKQIFCTAVGMDTLFIGRNIIELDHVDSTNSYANERLKKEILPEGTIIWTKNQTNGRGQRTNAWESEPFKNLTFSLILCPSFITVQQQFYLSKVISLALADFVAAILQEKSDAPQIKIKWPNDIYIGDKKVAGILIENSIRNNQLVNSVVGIGLNINQEKFNKSLPKATALKLHHSTELDLNTCLGQLCSFLEARYLQLKANKQQCIDEDYLEKMYLLNEWSSFKTSEQIIRAKIIGVSAEGKLQVELEKKQSRAFDFKEIVFLH